MRKINPWLPSFGISRVFHIFIIFVDNADTWNTLFFMPIQFMYYLSYDALCPLICFHENITLRTHPLRRSITTVLYPWLSPLQQFYSVSSRAFLPVKMADNATLRPRFCYMPCYGATFRDIYRSC
ncbi:hypothetical protein JR316_0006831 [Psilocybe cubensis]|uniref:Uncharacterized protein n=1 Tax=Psilocybe cubensis TaxID=181762 RepID=A0ACB8GX80_PSICU|nr:hypothetical protein JR316_0006831 [Psilocybe cubensis]KAH9480233.1 hypothetical protein JR316_0006831 [Psilocybe cubensis]